MKFRRSRMSACCPTAVAPKRSGEFGLAASFYFLFLRFSSILLQTSFIFSEAFSIFPLFFSLIILRYIFLNHSSLFWSGNERDISFNSDIGMVTVPTPLANLFISF